MNPSAEVRTGPILAATYRIVSGNKSVNGIEGVCTFGDRVGRGWRVQIKPKNGPAVMAFDTELVLVSAPKRPVSITAATAFPRTEVEEGEEFCRLVAELAQSSREMASLLGVERRELNLPWGWHVAHVPNGGGRSRREGAEFKASGVRSGVPDYQLDVARFDPEIGRTYHGWRGELKRADGGRTSEAQKEWLSHLVRNGYRVGVHAGAEALFADLRWYLSLHALDAGIPVLKAA
jgi:hypothetical protein